MDHSAGRGMTATMRRERQLAHHGGGGGSSSSTSGHMRSMSASASAAAAAAAGDSSSGEHPSVSLSRLSKSDFQAEEYLRTTLRSAPEGGMRQFRKALEDARKSASRSLQRNVYKNYESFVFISKEISSMERDMQLLRELLHSINQVGDDLMDDDADGAGEGLADMPQGRAAARRRTMRMSMANQNDLFKDQLARVWSSVRDAQRFVPYAPGRHVVGDVRNAAELSPATLQSRQRVDIIVLSDMLLVAVRTKRSAHAAQPALVADRAFVLADVAVADVSDVEHSAFLVRIVNRAETFLFGLRSADAKNELLMLIAHAKAGVLGGMPPGAEVPAMPALPRQLPNAAASGAADPDGLRAHAGDLLDTLDIHIARREFADAAAAVQRLNAALGDQPSPAMRRAADAHTAELARLVLADLRTPCAPRAQAAANVRLLHTLGWDKEAKEAFLAARSATIKNRTRQLKLEGSTSLYIRELAIVYFRLIRNTCEWYSSLFADPTLVSALIAWVRREMAGYAVIFRRHVFHDAQRFRTIAGCLAHTLAEVDILGHAGLDLKFMLDQEFFPDLTATIRSYEARVQALLSKAVADDRLAVASKIDTSASDSLARAFGPYIPIVASVSKLDEVLTDFGDELRHIARDSLYGQVVASVLAIIEGLLKQFLALLRRSSANLSYAQEMALLVSTQAVVSWVIPRCAAHLDRIFGRTVSDIHNLEQRLEAFPGSLQDVFCQKHAVSIAKASFDFVTRDFAADEAPAADPRARRTLVDDTMAPSAEMEQLLTRLGHVARELDNWPLPKRAILSGIIDCMFVQMIDPRNWETSAGEKRRFSHLGVHSLVLDIHFLLRVCGSLVSKSTNNMANRVCEKGLRAYFAQTSGGGAPAGEMMNKSWYDARVLDTMQRLGFAFPDFGKGFEHRSQQSFDSLASGSAAANAPPSSGSPSTVNTTATTPVSTRNATSSPSAD
ncbi:exocyst complex component exo84 [Coemansia erecta]|uniref:Exocyst complex component EXO84 n=1 Tax=Coemansia erecta TaxID=147472 RepID=A0A9W7XY00_9FUNG|nr:exocyst complex component exo84 [Coemansia erecta]